jgi:hypothetical protein
MVHDHPLTIPSAAFASELATHDDPRTVAEPLAHRLSLEAPSGIVLGIARTQTRIDGPDLVPRRVSPRHSVQRARQESAVVESQQPWSEEPLADEPESSDVAPAPLRHLPVSTSPAPALPLTHVTAENGPRPLAPIETATPEPETVASETTTAEPAHEPPMTEVPAFPRLTLGQSRRLGLGAPIARVPDSAASVQRSTDSAPQKPERPFTLLDFFATKAPPPPAPAPISRPQRIPSTRMTSPTISRSAEPEAATPPDEEPAVQELADATVSTSSIPPETPAAVQRESEMSASPSILGPQLSKAHDAANPADPSVELAGTAPLTSEIDPIQRLVTGSPTDGPNDHPASSKADLPLAAPRPAAPLQREASATDVAEENLGGAPANESAAATPSAGDRLAMASREPSAMTTTQRLQDSANGGSSAGLILQRATDTTIIPRPRIPGRSAELSSPSTVGDGRALVGPAGSHTPLLGSSGFAPVLVSRSVAPATSSSTGAGRSATASPGAWRQETAMATLPDELPLQRMPSLTSAVAPRSTRESPLLPGIRPFGANGSLEPEPEASRLPELFVQRAAGPEWTVQAAPAPAAASAMAEAPAAAIEAAEAAAAPGHRDEQERMEDLAAKLYDHIRVKLRNELLVDRERAGFLTDLR